MQIKILQSKIVMRVYMLIQKNGTMSAEEIIAKCDEVNATKEMQVRDGVAAIKKLHVITATKELHDEENVAKQVASQGRMEFKFNDEAFNKLQKKVIKELVAKLKLLERKFLYCPRKILFRAALLCS